jgi:hypothetical protein
VRERRRDRLAEMRASAAGMCSATVGRASIGSSIEGRLALRSSTVDSRRSISLAGGTTSSCGRGSAATVTMSIGRFAPCSAIHGSGRGPNSSRTKRDNDADEIGVPSPFAITLDRFEHAWARLQTIFGPLRERAHHEQASAMA